MTRAFGVTIVIIVLLGSLLGACKPQEKESPPATTGPGPTTASTQPTKQAWEKEWEETVQAAKREGSVSVYTQWGPEARTELIRAFKEKFGLDLEFTAVGKSAEIATKMGNERRAGLYMADVIGTGPGTIFTMLDPEGLVAPIDSMLILPEVIDPKVRVGGKLFLDKGKKVIPLSAQFVAGVTRNTDLVKEGEIKSYSDVLDPKWKGKIIMHDPTTTGEGQAAVTLMVRLWGLDKSRDYLRQLALQEPVFTRDLRLQVEWLARAKYPVGVGLHTPTLMEFKAMGSPVAQIRPLKEGGLLTTAFGTLCLPSGKLPHPNATRVFINWLLTKEGQSLFSKSIFQPSSRIDVPLEKAEEMTAMPGEPYIEQYDDAGLALMATGQVEKLSQEVFGPLLK